MGNKSSPQLILSFLLIAALRLDSLIVKRGSYLIFGEMNWTEARNYCQKNYIDMITWKQAHAKLSASIVKLGVTQIWIGLHRDPEKGSNWRPINVKTGVGLLGDDLSQSTAWAEGQHSGHCAVIGDDQLWYSDLCSSEYHVYCSSGERVNFHEVKLNWSKAVLYCKDLNYDLAIIMETSRAKSSLGGWIGLYQQAGNNWDWISDGPSDYRNWAPGEPLTADCASFDATTQKWYSKKCSQKLPFLCTYDNLLLVKKNKTWDEALRYCRGIKKDCDDSSGVCKPTYEILNLPDLSEYSYVRGRIYKATTDEVWVGLRFLGGTWWWTNGDEPANKEMLMKCPLQWDHCGTVSKYGTDNWITRDCSEKRNFICHKIT